jgi:hypothetical protein
MGFKTLSFFCPVLGGPPGEAGSAPLRRADRCGVSCRRRSGSSVSPVGSPLESGVSPAHIGPRNACPRAAPETTPLWRLFLIKLSLSLSLTPCLCYSWCHRHTDARLTSGRHFPQHEAGRATDCQGPIKPTFHSPLKSATGGLYHHHTARDGVQDP